MPVSSTPQSNDTLSQQDYYYTLTTAKMTDTYNLVQSHYGEIAKRNTSSTQQQAQIKEENVAKSFGYTADDLASLPDKTNLGLSCGNPVGLANVKEGETVLDLGSGAGIDVFLAAKKVGGKGRAIGVDMTRVCAPSPLSHTVLCTT